MLRQPGKPPRRVLGVPVTLKNGLIASLLMVLFFFSWLHATEKCSMGNNLKVTTLRSSFLTIIITSVLLYCLSL
jgi:hypothetical protein